MVNPVTTYSGGVPPDGVVGPDLGVREANVRQNHE